MLRLPKPVFATSNHHYRHPNQTCGSRAEAVHTDKGEEGRERYAVGHCRVQSGDGIRRLPSR